MPPSKTIKRFRARHSFGVMLDGEQITVQQGEIVRDGHPVLKGRAEHFEPIDSFGRFDVDVEQATQAPGEKRGDRAA